MRDFRRATISNFKVYELQRPSFYQAVRPYNHLLAIQKYTNAGRHGMSYPHGNIQTLYEFE